MTMHASIRYLCLEGTYTFLLVCEGDSLAYVRPLNCIQFLFYAWLQE